VPLQFFEDDGRSEEILKQIDAAVNLTAMKALAASMCRAYHLANIAYHASIFWGKGVQPDPYLRAELGRALQKQILPSCRIWHEELPAVGLVASGPDSGIVRDFLRKSSVLRVDLNHSEP
jgi:hypothetical protein